jgi:methyl-accepting chemotaxis protein
MLLRKLSIGKRAAAGFGVITLILVFVGLFSLAQMATLDRAANRINDVWLPGISSIQRLSINIATVRLEGQRIRGTDNFQVQEKSKALILDAERQIETQLASYRARTISPEQSQLIDTLESALASYMPALDKTIALIESKNRDEVQLQTLNNLMVSTGNKLTRGMDDLIRLNEAGSNAAAQETRALYSKMELIIWLVLAGSVAITVWLAWTLTRSIVTPIRQALSVAETIAAGNLGQHFEIHGDDEPALLLRAMHRMQLSLRSTILGISESAEQLAAAAEQMSAVMGHSTLGLQQQSNEIDQAATAVTQMSTAVHEVANNAVSTSQLSHVSDQESQKGHEEVAETITLIQGLAKEVLQAAEQAEHLSRHTDGISKVLSVIHSISDQTNLLALNAAIEAARAGEAGRGFAVVADEVRSLAKRTQASTREIGEMIASIQAGTTATVGALQSSAGKAEETLNRARSAGQALAQITLAISQISERNLLIASATEQQALVAREVDRSLESIRDLSTQSAAGASQTTSASQELARLAIGLNGMVTRFAL